MFQAVVMGYYNPWIESRNSLKIPTFQTRNQSVPVTIVANPLIVQFVKLVLCENGSWIECTVENIHSKSGAF